MAFHLGIRFYFTWYYVFCCSLQKLCCEVPSKQQMLSTVWPENSRDAATSQP